MVARTMSPQKADKSEQLKRLQDQLHYREGEIMNAEVRIKELEEVSAMTDLEENELSELRNRVMQANAAIKIVEGKILQLTSEPDEASSSTLKGKRAPARKTSMTALKPTPKPSRKRVIDLSALEVRGTPDENDDKVTRSPEPTDNQPPSRKRKPDEQQTDNETPLQQKKKILVDKDTLERLLRSNEKVEKELCELKIAKSTASQNGKRQNDKASKASSVIHRMAVEEHWHTPNGMATLATPVSHLDLRNLLWPHVPIEVLKAIAVNTFEVTKLHLLIPPDYASRVVEVKERKHKDDEDEDEADIRASCCLQRLTKQFPTKDHWMSALLMWGGIKAQLQPSMPYFLMCLTVHIVRINKFTATYGWDQVLNYEIQFFQRYQAMTEPKYIWALVDTQIQADYVVPKKGIGSSTSPSDTLCLKFQNQKDCSSNCRYQHRCTYDQTRCNGPHVAAHCPLNPNRVPPPTKSLSNRILDGQRRGNNGYNPNFDPVKRDQNHEKYNGGYSNNQSNNNGGRRD